MSPAREQRNANACFSFVVVVKRKRGKKLGKGISGGRLMDIDTDSLVKWSLR
jgi:hypothetical protein